MHFFHHHKNKKERIAEDNGLLQRRVDVLDAENQSLKTTHVVREDIAKNAHLMSAPVSGQADGFVEEEIHVKRRSSSANELALGENAHILQEGKTTRIFSAAAAAQGGAGSSGSAIASGSSSLQSLGSSTTSTSTKNAGNATIVKRIISTEPARIIRAEVIRPEKHILKESGCVTEKITDKATAKDGNIVEEVHMRRKSLDAAGDTITEDLTIKAVEREVPKKQQIKTETHVNYVPMGRPKAHDRDSPAPASEVVDHLTDKLEFSADAKAIESSGTPLHKDLAFPLPESMTKLPKGLDADKDRVKTFERDLEISKKERLIEHNEIVEGVLSGNDKNETFEEMLEYQKIVHQQ